MRQLIVALVCGSCVSAAHAQTGIRYKLDPGSTLTQERCLGPCACALGPIIGPMAGTFTLTLLNQGPLFTEFALSAADLGAALEFYAVTFRGQGQYRLGGEVALTQEITLSLIASSPPSPSPQTYASGPVAINPQVLFPKIDIAAPGPLQGCFKNTLHLVAAPVACQADCDASGGLNANDFMCFLNLYAAGDAYANCDGSSSPPVLTANDFQCYLNRFAAGCPR